MSRFFSKIRLQYIDWLLPVIVFILVSIGFAAIYSVDLSRGTSLDFFPRQVIAFCIGVVVLFVASQFNVSFYRHMSRFGYVISALALALVLFFGVSIRGTTGWFRFAGFSFQPAELAKVGLILFLAWLITRHGRRFDRWQFVVGSGLATILLSGLILLQPDLGSALILGAIWFGLLFLSRTKLRYIATIVGIGIVSFVCAWFFLFADYQKERLLTFVDPARDPLGSGYNVSQSVIAVGSGKIFGRGLGFGSQSQLHFLPEAQTDFIFAVIAEELGFVAVFMVFTLYVLLFWRLLRIAAQSTDDFSTYVVFGICLLFFIQVILNVGASIGVLPVTGITLPFLSYGGSSLIINLFLIGLAESIARSVRIDSQKVL